MLHPQLETFIKVIECGSFSKAASVCNCSAVSVMNQINALEDRIGIQLLIRSTQGVRLTQAGQSFYEDAKKIIEMSAQAVRNAQRCVNGNKSVIRIGASVLHPCKPLLDYLENHEGQKKDQFQIEIVTFDDETEEFRNMLNSLGDKIDSFVSVCDNKEWREKFGIYQLGTCRCCVSLPHGHRLARKRTLSWEDMYGESIILVKEGISPVIDQIRSKIGRVHPDITIIDSKNCYDMDTFNKCERIGCLMEIPEIWAKVHPSLVTLPVQWEYELPYGIIYGYDPSPACKEFIDSLNCGNDKS